MEWLEDRTQAEREVLGKAEERYGAPSLAAHRVDLHNALREMCVEIGVKVHEKVTVVKYDAQEGIVMLEDGKNLRADVVVAADGVKSKAHKWVIGEESPATRSRLRNVRFTLSTDSFREIEELMVPDAEAAVAMSAVYAGPKQNVMLLRYSCRGSVPHLLLVDQTDKIQRRRAKLWPVRICRTKRHSR